MAKQPDSTLTFILNESSAVSDTKKQYLAELASSLAVYSGHPLDLIVAHSSLVSPLNHTHTSAPDLQRDTLTLIFDDSVPFETNKDYYIEVFGRGNALRFVDAPIGIDLNLGQATQDAVSMPPVRSVCAKCNVLYFTLDAISSYEEEYAEYITLIALMHMLKKCYWTTRGLYLTPSKIPVSVLKTIMKNNAASGRLNTLISALERVQNAQQSLLNESRNYHRISDESNLVGGSPITIPEGISISESSGRIYFTWETPLLKLHIFGKPESAVPIGKWIIQVKFSLSGEGNFNVTVKPTHLQFQSGYPHPHVSLHTPCLNEFAPAISRAIMHGNYLDVKNLLESHLCTYYRPGAYVTYESALGMHGIYFDAPFVSNQPVSNQ